MHLLPENSFKKQRHIQTDELCNIAHLKQSNHYLKKKEEEVMLLYGNGFKGLIPNMFIAAKESVSFSN
jgi:hypothetical protein